MKLGVMQPYFFPHLGYFDLIRRVDRFVLFDTAQFTPKSWMTRNRILHPASGWQYILLPVAQHPRFAAISQIRAKDPEAAMRRILGQLGHYRKRAPHYAAVTRIVEDAFATARSDSLTDINAAGLARVCQELGLPFQIEICSELGLNLPPVEHPGGWALEISAALGASEYINPPGGRELFRPEEFAARGVGLGFTQTPDFSYPCPPYAFEPQLSILDVLMWRSPAQIRADLAAAQG
ncbi:WbqC-like family protein [Desulfarculus baarsii DSM 2075]|uniref:WbqC-like family protein n=1 Tax=Desulfarculus baarsii (strain ATCC 33931 / DSM 2075 / LMG 7858 / VKM B-1802 / 2st14) TaxID=644282 RepID=E1QIZ4_DESB2|nr:WbqC family protein [Desulfarculus baarsii]ADK85537.1 WbqC-like family protein [Desulfarculus baarsii DSM 2075]